MKIIVLIVATLLAGCAGFSRNSSTIVAVYDFGQPAPYLGDSALKVRGPMALEVRAAQWLDAPRMEYRLAYDNPLKRLHYVESRWASAPAGLLAQQLRQQLGLVGTSGGIAADCVLRLELHEFSQVFDSPQESRAVLQAQASVIDGKRRLLASRAVHIEKAAETPDAPGGVRALVNASEEQARQLAHWLGQLEQERVLNVCGSGR